MDYPTQPVRGDWYLFTQWQNPSTYLKFLAEQRQLPKELQDLVGVQQDPVWHPEGCAFSHTCHVVDAMADIVSREGITGERRVVFMLAAVCHDMGKAVSTWLDQSDQRWKSPGHDVTGVPIATRFLRSAEASPEVTAQVLPLVRWHMAHCRKAFTPKAVRKLARELQPVPLKDLLLLMEADCMGRGTASSGLPEAVMTQLVPLAQANGWMDGPDPKDRR